MLPSSTGLANPLYVQWVSEWMEETRSSGSSMFKAYKRAHESLIRCEKPFTHPSQAIELFGIGPTICRKLERKWEEHCAKEGIPVRSIECSEAEEESEGVLEEQGGSQNSRQKSVSKPRKQTKPKVYVPAFRSGAYAILLALYENVDEKPYMSKSEIIACAAKHCDASFTDPEPGKYYTAWNSMKTLLQKEYVERTGNPGRFSISDTGCDVAKRLAQVSEKAVAKKLDSGEDNDSLENNESLSSQPLDISTESLIMKAGTFDIIFVLDNREKRHRNDGGFIEQQLLGKGIKVQVRPLEIGDGIWIAKRRDSCKGSCYHDEFVLNYILERKRMDDLVGSIKDGRFHEQKYRLASTGLEVIYLIEETNLQTGVAFGWDAVQTAMSSTQVVNGFFLKRTTTNDESIEYLANLTKMIERLSCDKDLIAISPAKIQKELYLEQKNDLLITYSTFSELFSKSRALTFGDVYAKMLLTIKGLSAEKVVEILKVYPTHSDLMNAFREAERTDDENGARTLLSRQFSGYGRKKIGLALSEKVRQVYRDMRY